MPFSRDEIPTSRYNINSTYTPLVWFVHLYFFLAGCRIMVSNQRTNSFLRGCRMGETNTGVTSSSSRSTQIHQSKLQALRNRHELLLYDFGNILSVEGNIANGRGENKANSQSICQNLKKPDGCSEPVRNH